jgi:hypothetical protein
VPNTPRSHATKGATRDTGSRKSRSRRNLGALRHTGIDGSTSSGHGKSTSPCGSRIEASSLSQPACTSPMSSGTRSTGVPATLTFSPMRNQSVPLPGISSRLSSKSSVSNTSNGKSSDRSTTQPSSCSAGMWRLSSIGH